MYINGFNENSNKPLQQDNVFPTVEIKTMSEVTGLNNRKGLDKVILVNDTIMNIVSNQYGLLLNEDFFPLVNQRLTEANFAFDIRSVNRSNGAFAMDFILSGDNYSFKLKGGNDEIRPFLRFTNSYDGSTKTAGHFGFFRKVCSNGLHVATSKIGFSIKHRGEMTQVVMPNLEKLLFDFMNNEFFSIHRNFEILNDCQCDPKEALKQVVNGLNLWKWEASEKNPEPSINSRLALQIVERESKELGIEPNMWLVYNALNDVVHNKLKQPFQKQQAIDKQVFDFALAMAEN